MLGGPYSPWREGKDSPYSLFDCSLHTAGQDSGKCVCYRCDPSHTHGLYSLSVFLGHHCAASWIQALLRQEGQL